MENLLFSASWWNLVTDNGTGRTETLDIIYPMVLCTLVHIDSGNGLVTDGTKPLPEPMLTYPYGFFWRSSKADFSENAQDIRPWYESENYKIKITTASPRGQWFNGPNFPISTASRDRGYCGGWNQRMARSG